MLMGKSIGATLGARNCDKLYESRFYNLAPKCQFTMTAITLNMYLMLTLATPPHRSCLYKGYSPLTHTHTHKLELHLIVNWSGQRTA